jgi:putative Ca2+/H+ antiporter (TMEM165/GDT1 family)
MDWKLALSTFTAIFLAEMGDKTQLLVVTWTASSKKPLNIFLSSVIALTAVTALGVLAGEAVIKVVPEHALKKIAAILFIALGIWTWIKA